MAPFKFGKPMLIQTRQAEAPQADQESGHYNVLMLTMTRSVPSTNWLVAPVCVTNTCNSKFTLAVGQNP